MGRGVLVPVSAMPKDAGVKLSALADSQGGGIWNAWRQLGAWTNWLISPFKLTSGRISGISL